MLQTGRLSWQCRRGAKELDELLQRYLRHRYPAASLEEQQAFEHLLELPDPVLQDYLAGLLEPHEAQLRHVVQRIVAADT